MTTSAILPLQNILRSEIAFEWNDWQLMNSGNEMLLRNIVSVAVGRQAGALFSCGLLSPRLRPPWPRARHLASRLSCWPLGQMGLIRLAQCLMGRDREAGKQGPIPKRSHRKMLYFCTTEWPIWLETMICWLWFGNFIVLPTCHVNSAKFAAAQTKAGRHRNIQIKVNQILSQDRRATL